MISLNNFLTLIQNELNRTLDDNIAQREAVSYDGESALMLVAGPGSGKSTVLVLRALRHVFVDDILPEKIIITTFTVKAAKELRTRWLDWGIRLIEALSIHNDLEVPLSRIDLNRCRISTLDSLAEQTLTDNRFPGEVAPILLEESAARLILKRVAFRDVYEANQTLLNQFFARYTFDGNPPRTHGEALTSAKNICDRLIQDQVNLANFVQAGPANTVVVEILNRYRQSLADGNMFDFANLEQRFLERLRDGSLNEWRNEIDALLIDEYQDTNPLQEAIYFEIIPTPELTITVVGDDDQAMYRFRGGSVELFTEFSGRCLNATGRQSRRINMIANYRSSGEIVDFYNNHIIADPQFSAARILPPKPLVVSERGSVNIPVLGLFRPTVPDLANDLASFLYQLFQDRHMFFGGNNEFELTLTDGADFGDLVLLSHSVEEITYNRFNNNSEQRFTGYLRNSMRIRGQELFNPRGRAIRTIINVQRLLGLLLLCLDPDENLTQQVLPTNEAQFYLREWRLQATNFIDQNPMPMANNGLNGFVYQWQQASRNIPNPDFPPDWPVLELIFKLISWLPDFQNDPEHQVWLEVITRTVSSSAIGSPYGMQILRNEPHSTRSRQSFIRDALLPIAGNEVDVDEDIMPSVPRNRLQIMTIHQAKGLEFPLVIVDVGSRFNSNHAAQSFLRFPAAPSNVVVMEDDVEPFLPTPLRQGRMPIDRSFDDLIRLFYVAYSRPQSVLLLIGNESCLRYGRGTNFSQGAIPNVALGWARNRTWAWRQPFIGRRPPVRVNTPFFLI